MPFNKALNPDDTLYVLRLALYFIFFALSSGLRSISFT